MSNFGVQIVGSMFFNHNKYKSQEMKNTKKRKHKTHNISTNISQVHSNDMVPLYLDGTYGRVSHGILFDNQLLHRNNVGVDHGVSIPLYFHLIGPIPMQKY